MDEVLRLAMELPDEDRLQLAEALWASVEQAWRPPFDAEWIAEAKRRAGRIDAGEGQSSTWAEVRDRARSHFEPEVTDNVVAEQPHPPLSEAKRQELDRRIADEKAKPGDGVPWEEVEAATLAKFGR